MDWDDDERDVFNRATTESIPPSVAANSKKDFGITSNTQFSATSSNYDVIRRNTSQTNKKTPIIPGFSLSTQKAISTDTDLKPGDTGNNSSNTLRRIGRVWEQLTPAVSGNATANGSSRGRSSTPVAPAALNLLPVSAQSQQKRYGKMRSNQGLPVDSLLTHGAAQTTRIRGAPQDNPEFLAQKKEEFNFRSKGASSGGSQHSQQERRPDPEPTPRAKRNTRRTSGVNEVIDLMDDDDDEQEEVAVIGTGAGAGEGGVRRDGASGGSAAHPENIFKTYASIPGVSRPEGRHTLAGYGATEEPVAVDRIYLGLRGFRGSEVRPVYVRVDCGVNDCLLLALGDEGTGEGGSGGDAMMEEIPFARIKKITCGRVRREEYQHEAMMSVSVEGELTLRSAGVGPSCMLCPTLPRNNSSESTKNILLMMSAENLDTLKEQLLRVPAWSKIANKMVTYYSAQSVWLSSTLKEVAVAHLATNGVSWQALQKEWRERAAKELDQRQRGERRRQRSARLLGGESVDPTDCEPYTVYPIEPEVIDAITIFKGDLKRLRPEEYLNDNLIDLQIKYLVRTALSEQLQSRVHAFNCQFYSRLTTHERDMRSGHALVARWTKSVDLFDRDFVLIPINYSYHWSLAVIIRPGAVLPVVEALQAGDFTQLQRSPPSSQSSGSGSGRKKGARQAAAGGLRQRGSPAAGNTGASAIVVEGDSEQQQQQQPESEEATSGPDTGIAKALFSPTAAVSVNSSSPMDEEGTDTMAVAAAPQEELAAAAAASAQHMLPCILHMDSLGMHGSFAIGKRLKSYLMLEWEARKMPALNADLDNRIAALRQERGEDGEAPLPDDAEEARLRKALEVRRKKVFEEIPVVKCKVPMQANGYDCGLFVTKFAEMVLRRAPSSTAADIENKFAALLPATDFSQTDVDAERLAMRQRIDQIKADRDQLKHELHQRKAREAALRQQQGQDAAETATAAVDTTSPSSSAGSGGSEGEGVASSSEDDGGADRALQRTPVDAQAIRGLEVSQLKAEAEAEAAADTQASDFDALMLQDAALPSQDDAVKATKHDGATERATDDAPSREVSESRRAIFTVLTFGSGLNSDGGDGKGKAKKGKKHKKEKRRGSEDSDFPSRSVSSGSDGGSLSGGSRASADRAASSHKRARGEGEGTGGSSGRSKTARREGDEGSGQSHLVDRMFQGGVAAAQQSVDPSATPRRTVDAFVAQHAPSSASALAGVGHGWSQPHQAGEEEEEEDVGEEVDLSQVLASAGSGTAAAAGGKVRYATGAEAARNGAAIAPGENRAQLLNRMGHSGQGSG